MDYTMQEEFLLHAKDYDAGKLELEAAAADDAAEAVRLREAAIAQLEGSHYPKNLLENYKTQLLFLEERLIQTDPEYTLSQTSLAFLQQKDEKKRAGAAKLAKLRAERVDREKRKAAKEEARKADEEKARKADEEKVARERALNKSIVVKVRMPSGNPYGQMQEEDFNVLAGDKVETLKDKIASYVVVASANTAPRSRTLSDKVAYAAGWRSRAAVPFSQEDAREALKLYKRVAPTGNPTLLPRELDNKMTLHDSGVNDNETLHLAQTQMLVAGGGKKSRKRKTTKRTTIKGGKRKRHRTRRRR